MAVTRDTTQRRAAGVAFEVDRISWPAPDRLEVVGRWFGVRGRRFIRPTLDVEVDGDPRRLLAVLDHKPWAVEDGEEWVAAFKWYGDPVDLAGSELTVGPDIAVELGPPRVDGAREPRAARRPRVDVLEGELETVRREVRRLERELHAARAQHTAELNRQSAEHRAELERMREAGLAAEQEAERGATTLRSELESERRRTTELQAALRNARQELAVARADLSAQREGLVRERAALATEAAAAAADELETLREERDAARRESAAARAARDSSRRESAQARAERDAAVRERDAARQARNAYLTRARAEGGGGRPAEPSASDSATPAPAPAARRTVVRIPAEPSDEVELPGSAPSELNWQPESSGRWRRAGGIVAGILLAAALVLLLSVTAAVAAPAEVQFEVRGSAEQVYVPSATGA